jgi:ArsR family transcriptional regulator, arsenate/arsenite/antimonite-responsive transcriptional repressor
MTPDTPADLDLRRLRALYRALGDTTRLRIVTLLAERGPMSVSEVSAGVGLSQPLISWHLRIMRLAGLISTERRGRETRCQLRRSAFDEMHEVEARLLSGGLEPDAPPHGAEVADVG